MLVNVHNIKLNQGFVYINLKESILELVRNSKLHTILFHLFPFA